MFNLDFIAAAALYLGVLAAVVWLWPRLLDQTRPAIRWVLLVLIGGASLLHQYVLRITAEDGFITFRYARNLARGLGPVFNPGERVEGYSDFLWMLLLAGCNRVAGVDIPATARVLGGVAALLTLWVVFRLVSDATARDDRPNVHAGLVAALLVAASSSFAAWGSNGMEMSLFVLLWMAALLAVLRRASVLAGCLFGLCTMTRPEGVVLLGPVVVWMLLDTSPLRARLLAITRIVGAFTVVLIPWTLWRVAYYGVWMPNTLSAKSGMAPVLQLKQGVLYLIDCLIGHGGYVVLAAVVVLVSAPVGPRRTLWLVGASTIVTALFVCAVGGDWMPAWRLLVPAVTGAAVCLALLWAAASPSGELHLGSRAAIALVAVVSIVQFGTTWSHPKVLPFVRDWADMIRANHDIGEWFRRSLPADTLMATHSNGAPSYYSELPTIDMIGLTDRHIALAGHRRRNTGTAGHLAYDYAYVAQRKPFLVYSQGYGFDKAPTTHYLRDEFRADYSAVCFRFESASNPTGRYVNLLLLHSDRERLTELLEKDRTAAVVSCELAEPVPPARDPLPK